jgi:2-hydroxychromene-2-carboxylate isomerase
MSDTVVIDFYLGLGSRYSYLAATQISRIEAQHHCRFRWKPIASGALMDPHWIECAQRDHAGIEHTLRRAYDEYGLFGRVSEAAPLLYAYLNLAALDEVHGGDNTKPACRMQ